MRRRGYLLGGAATVALTAATLTAVAVVQPGPWAASGGATVRPGAPWAISCAVPALPGQQVDVVLADRAGGPMMGGAGNGGWGRGGPILRGRMMLHVAPQAVAAGTVSFRVANHGSRLHELVVLPLAVGSTAGARAVGTDDRVDEAGSLGEASRDCGAGAGEGIQSGGASWITVSLQPGRYELVCNLPGHYAAGMYAELDVA